MTTTRQITELSLADHIALAYVHERDSLTRDLTHLDEHEWTTPSLCTGWTVRDLVAHLLMPYELGGLAFLGRLVAARFNFDRLASDWARHDRRTGPELLRTLAKTTAAEFNVPGAGPLAPLSHLTIHAYDVRGALDISTTVGAVAGRMVLDDVTAGKHSVPAGRLLGLHLRATDADWQLGEGKLVEGSSGVLLSALSGRRIAADQLVGDGVETLRARLP